MKSECIIASFGFLLSLVSCSISESDATLDLKAIEAELQIFESNHKTAIETKNIDSILQYYATDLITITQGEQILYGRDWIPALMDDLYKNYDFHEDFKLGDVRIMGDRVVASLTFNQQMIPLNGGEMITSTGKGMCVLKRSGKGIWQFEWNSYNNVADDK